ncbi:MULTISPECIES: porin [unclassified Inquilinus]|uniref:porin n=1 Tax=unclassified Inquilinus TaxID=2645927 RepID=UPI003F8E44B2
MKRIAPGSATIAIMTVLSAPASAEITVKINGFVGFQAGIVLSDSSSDKHDRDYDFMTASRLQFDVTNTTDSGLDYGARIRLDGVDRRNGVQVNRTYVYLRGPFGTFTFGDAPTVLGEIGYFYAHDAVHSKLGFNGGFGDGLDGVFQFGGSDYFSLDPSGQSGVSRQTKIKYNSPSIGGFQFAVDFTPVDGAKVGPSRPHDGSGGVDDLTNDDATLYQNVTTAGVQYRGKFDHGSFAIGATAGYGDGIASKANQKGNDLTVVSLGGQVLTDHFGASVNWVHNASIALSNTEMDTISFDLSYVFEAASISTYYSYTWLPPGSGLKSPATNGVDLKQNDVAGVAFLYSLAPGLGSYAELFYQKQDYYSGDTWESTDLFTGIQVLF